MLNIIINQKYKMYECLFNNFNDFIINLFPELDFIILYSNESGIRYFQIECPANSIDKSIHKLNARQIVELLRIAIITIFDEIMVNEDRLEMKEKNGKKKNNN